jgi:hypothetical protein
MRLCGLVIDAATSREEAVAEIEFSDGLRNTVRPPEGHHASALLWLIYCYERRGICCRSAAER